MNSFSRKHLVPSRLRRRYFNAQQFDTHDERLGVRPATYMFYNIIFTLRDYGTKTREFVSSYTLYSRCFDWVTPAVITGVLSDLNESARDQ